MNKILIIKHGSLGDIILAFSALASIRNHYKNSKIFLLTERKYFTLFYRSPYVDNCIEDDRKNNLLSSLFRLKNLIRYEFDLIIDLQNSKRTFFYNLLFRSFISAKISSSRPFVHYRYRIPKQGTETVSEGLFNQLKMLGIKKINIENYSWLKSEINEKIMKPLALFIPGVSVNGFNKQWQPHKFAEVAKFLEKHNYTICIIGNTEDTKSAIPIINSCKNILNKIDQSPPEIIYSLALNSKIIFSNDTGPGHVASLSKNNFVWIVNDNNVSKANQPLGDHVYKVKSDSVKNISSNEIISLIKRLNLF